MDDGSDEGLREELGEELGEDTAAVVSYPLGDCPKNWVDPEFVEIECAPGFMILTIEFQGHECVRCVPDDDDDDDDDHGHP